MKIRPVINNDLLEIKCWFHERWKIAEFSMNILPSFGFVVEKDTGDLLRSSICAACWVFRDVEGRFCYLVFPVTSPALSVMESYRALEYLILETEKEMKKLGFAVIHAAGKEGLAQFYRRHGWVPGDQDTSQFFKTIIGDNHGT